MAIGLPLAGKVSNCRCKQAVQGVGIDRVRQKMTHVAPLADNAVYGITLGQAEFVRAHGVKSAATASGLLGK